MLRVPRLPELEAAIAVDPSDPAPISVWADALSGAGHPLGTWLQLALLDPAALEEPVRRAAEALLSEHGQWWYGPLERSAVWARGAIKQARRALPIDHPIVLPPRVVAPLGTATTSLGLVDEARGTHSFLRHLGERPTAFALRRATITGPSVPTEPLRGLPTAALDALTIEKPARSEGIRLDDLPPRMRELVLDDVPLAGPLRGGLRTLGITASEAYALDALATSALPELVEVTLAGPIDVSGLVQADLPALARVTARDLLPADRDRLRDVLGGRLGGGLVIA